MSGGTHENAVTLISCPPAGLIDRAILKTIDDRVAPAAESWHHDRRHASGSMGAELTEMVMQGDSSLLPGEDPLKAQFETAMKDREFSLYVSDISKIRRHFEDDLESLRSKLAADYAEMTRAEQAAEAASPRNRLWATFIAHTLITSLVTAIAVVLLLGIYVSLGGPFFSAT
ncbi:MAG: hypothetical protein ABSA53_02670 [Streptosporangiaceae bacterium]|jgi:hypothetical protein